MRLILITLALLIGRLNPDLMVGLMAFVAQAQPPVQPTPDLWERILNAGTPLFILLAGGAILARVLTKSIIPFVMKRIEQGDADRRIEQKEFLDAINTLSKAIIESNATRDKTQSEASASRDRVQQTSNEAILALTAAIHERFGEVRQRTQR